MAQETVADPTYVMGRTEAEAQRLMLQSQLYDRLTRRFLADAGITSGMSVLDVGSGAGDVALAAADLVGPTGRVVGVDLNPAVLETARARAEAEQRENVRFVAGDCRTADLPDDFDAAVGRFVLFYTSNITETLQAVAERVTPGGVVAFAEADFNTVLGYMQAGPEGENHTMWVWATQAFACAGIPTAMAGPLYRAFTAAGLGAPDMALHAPLGGDAGWTGFEWIAASQHSLLPIFEQYGIVTAEMLEVESLAARSRAEVIGTGFPLILLPVVTAWARKPLAGA
jgi:ubiquinone/menaquinone biosynthesis C-methylase UbiE